MISKVNISFDVPITSLGEAVSALVELLGIRVNDIKMQDRPQKEIAAVAEIIPPIRQRIDPEKSKTPQRKNRTNNTVSFQVGDLVPVHIPAGKVAVRNTRYAKLSDLTRARSLSDLEWRIPDADTIICPARREGVANFERDHVWKGVRGTPEKLPNIRFVAMYESAQGGGRGAVVAYAPVTSFKRR